MKRKRRSNKKAQNPKKRRKIGSNKNKDYLKYDISFAELSKKYPSFKNFLKNGNRIDFNDPLAQIELTKTILIDRYKIQWEFPNKKFLCPTVPKSVNYVKWIEELLTISGENTKKVVGIDIGCGASCIFALLGRSIYKWSFLCTEICKESSQISQQNVKLNNYEDSIKFILVDDKRKILNKIIPQNEKFNFCMCNPPFFENQEESTRNNPSRICLAQPNELVCEGGEVWFIKKIIDDSLILKNRISWYTSLIGKKSTVKKIKKYFLKKGIRNTKFSELIQGKTRRWVVAWNFFEKPLYVISTNLSIFLNNNKWNNSQILFQNIDDFLKEKNLEFSKISNKYLIQFNERENCTIEVMQNQINSFIFQLKTCLNFVTYNFQNFYEDLNQKFSMSKS